MDSAVVLFDGICNLCSWSVQFILRRDPHAYFRFAALQSPIGQRLLHTHGIDPDILASVVLIDQGTVYLQSEAALRIVRHLHGIWPVVSMLLVVPRPLRDRFYDWIATRRYRWFGQRASCLIASAATRNRFLDADTA